jgi:hypothetical protein
MVSETMGIMSERAAEICYKVFRNGETRHQIERVSKKNHPRCFSCWCAFLNNRHMAQLSLFLYLRSREGQAGQDIQGTDLGVPVLQQFKKGENNKSQIVLVKRVPFSLSQRAKKKKKTNKQTDEAE